jgi:DNA-binding NarL/FixJ family response regulator
MQTPDTPLRIVLVDDSAILRERLAALLSAIEGVQVVGQAPDAETGRALLRTLRPDVLVLDIGLPGESGIEWLKTLRPQTPSLVVIMCTQYAHPQFRRACAEAGADFFFDKSHESEGLLEAVRRLVAACSRRTGQ